MTNLETARLRLVELVYQADRIHAGGGKLSPDLLLKLTQACVAVARAQGRPWVLECAEEGAA